jgi:hypothetical protein
MTKTTVMCRNCDTMVKLEGPGDYNVESWEAHKATCHPASEPYVLVSLLVLWG